MTTTYRIPEGSCAVVLNAQAGRVTPRVARAIERLVGPEHVFLTRSEDHAREVLRRCVERGYEAVFAGGGDGTIVQAINTLAELVPAGGHRPHVGILPLGTGNALARWVGSADPLGALRAWRERAVHRIQPLRMVRWGDTMFPFGGLGDDAAVLNDYEDTRRRLAGTPLARLGRGLSGYLIAGLLRTIPRYLRRRRPEVEVVNLGRPAWRIDPEGEEIGPPIPTGGVLYRGPCSQVGAATTPVLGYGIRLYPHATRRADAFHLRLFDFSPLESLVHLPAAWRGRLVHPRCHDFYAERVRIRFDQAVPFQVGGDAAGYRDEVTFELARQPVALIGQA